MSHLLSQIINGLALGAGYALLAVGWSVLLSAARLVNFSHGQLYMVGAFVTGWGMSSFGLPYSVAVAFADGTALPAQYSDERVTTDQAVRALAGKVEVIPAATPEHEKKTARREANTAAKAAKAAK